MADLKTTNQIALRILMTDDLYIVSDQKQKSNVVKEIPLSGSAHFNYLGENNKFILILVKDPVKDIINEEDLTMLTSILTATKIELRDAAIVNMNKYPEATFNILKQFFACRKMVLFGINPVQLDMADIDSNKTGLFKETKILATFSFNEMRNDTVKKRLFWDAMKQF
jgi:hypothetical protein